MTNDGSENGSGPQSTVPPEYRVGYDWGKLEHELEEWGRSLDELRTQADAVGEEIVLDLERRYEDVRAQALVLKQRSEEQAKAAQAQSQKITDTMMEKAQEAGETIKKQSEELTAQAKATGDKMADAASDMGDGFARAWDELGKAFMAAYEKVKK